MLVYSCYYSCFSIRLLQSAGHCGIVGTLGSMLQVHHGLGLATITEQ